MHPGSLGVAAHLRQAEARRPAGHTVLFLLRNNPWLPQALRSPVSYVLLQHWLTFCVAVSGTALSGGRDGRCSCGVHQGRPEGAMAGVPNPMQGLGHMLLLYSTDSTRSHITS